MIIVIYLVNEGINSEFIWVFVILRIAKWPIEKSFVCIKKRLCQNSHAAIVHNQPEKYLRLHE